MPRASRSVVISTREEPERNSRMMTSRVFCGTTRGAEDHGLERSYSGARTVGALQSRFATARRPDNAEAPPARRAATAACLGSRHSVQSAHLVHVAVGGGHGVVALAHLVGQPVHLWHEGGGRLAGERKVPGRCKEGGAWQEGVTCSKGWYGGRRAAKENKAFLRQNSGQIVKRQVESIDSLSALRSAHLAAGVGEDDRLGDGQGLVQVAQGVQLPVLALHIDVELLDTLQQCNAEGPEAGGGGKREKAVPAALPPPALPPPPAQPPSDQRCTLLELRPRHAEGSRGVQPQPLASHLKGQLVALHQNAHGLVHELAGDLQRLGGQRGGEHAHLQKKRETSRRAARDVRRRSTPSRGSCAAAGSGDGSCAHGREAAAPPRHQPAPQVQPARCGTSNQNQIRTWILGGSSWKMS